MTSELQLYTHKSMHSVPALPAGMHSGVCMCVLQRALNFFFRQSKSGKESAVNGQLAETVGLEGEWTLPARNGKNR